MNFSGINSLKNFVQEEQKKSGKNVDYYFCIEQNVTKNEFLNDYYKFLKSSEYIPLDILNSKIQTFDVVHVPVLLVCISSKTRVSAEIGKNRIIRDEVRVWDENNHRYKTDYKETKVTDWHHEVFTVNYNSYGIFCNNKEFKMIIENAFGNGINDADKLRFCNYSDIPPRDIHRLSTTDYDKDTMEKWLYKKLEDNRKLIQKKIDEKGDLSRNVEYSLSDSTDKENIAVIQALLPIGYITYKYASSEYSYIKMLDSKDGILLQSTLPEHILPYEKYKASSKQLIKAYLGFWIVLFVGYWFFNTHFGLFTLNANSLHILTILSIIYAVIQIFDWLYIVGSEMSSEELYKTERKKYLQELFDRHENVLKNLLLTDDKSYKE